jgi:hypothetical protein
LSAQQRRRRQHGKTAIQGSSMTHISPGAGFVVLLGASFLAAAASSGPAHAAPTAADLGHGLTPFGAIQAGNAEGTIPPWTGGIATPPPGFHNSLSHPNPYGAEKPLFSISAGNMAQHAAQLTPGIQAMLRAYPGYRLDVFPSHRSFAAPQSILDAAIANAASAHLAPDGNSVLGAHTTIPFPIPHSGLEAIWNHLLRWRGYQAHFTSYAATPTVGGDYTLIKNDTKLLFPYDLGGASDTGILSLYLIKALEPPLYAGGMTVAKDHVDPAAHPREAWIYNPGEQRVRRAPEVNFDTPNPQADSLITDDDLDLFNGSPERFDWKLIGRQEFFVPYNDYEFGNPDHDYSEILKSQFINPDLMRWELHRVWVVQATLKPGAHHIYARRTFYYDEDSWEGLLADQYDRRGELWRVSSGAPICYYELPVLTNNANIFYDLQARRYHVRGMRNRGTMLDFFQPKLTPADFTPQALRDSGIR